MNDYITLKDDSAITLYKVKIIFPEWTQTSIQPMQIRRNIVGGANKQFGPGYDFYQCVAKVDHTPESGYISVAKLREWAKANTGQKQRLTLVDHFGTSVDVFLNTPVQPQWTTPIPDGAGGGWYYIPLGFETR